MSFSNKRAFWSQSSHFYPLIIQMCKSVLNCSPSKMSVPECRSVSAHRGVCFIYTKEVAVSAVFSVPKGPQRRGGAFVFPCSVCSFSKPFAFPHNSLCYIIHLKLCCSGISSARSVRSSSIIRANVMKNRHIIHVKLYHSDERTVPNIACHFFKLRK